LRRQKRKPLAQWIDVQAVRNDVLGKLRAWLLRVYFFPIHFRTVRARCISLRGTRNDHIYPLLHIDPSILAPPSGSFAFPSASIGRKLQPIFWPQNATEIKCLEKFCMQSILYFNEDVSFIYQHSREFGRWQNNQFNNKMNELFEIKGMAYFATFFLMYIVLWRGGKWKWWIILIEKLQT
jgi:hypothetical protein